MLISQLDSSNLTDEQITKLLYGDIEDDGRDGDCIFVVGSSKAVEYRLPKTVELYQSKRAQKILCSGGGRWPGSNYTEAEQLRQAAVHMGVPNEDILIEDISLHTKENVIASLLVLDRNFLLHKVKRLLVVTNAFHMRRLSLTLQTYMPDWIEFTLCPVNDRNTRKDNWFASEVGRERAMKEAKKIIDYVKLGVLKDMEIL
ncbi:DUF218 domain-containing protein [Gracilibacillus ureilyticus]|uniref:DUF218 domain-containing protein n=1 Tax=Gracilibacillus ureilyticus TaxID=531814 RepID=A0A1H9RSD1_9BACI|nr:YdcF family protein [Gracilibacillus ureilyticus]SER75851.1 DUF218 domain-containing protein [Gracilibacillus ureilyticus]